jgi:hypothetical protein
MAALDRIGRAMSRGRLAPFVERSRAFDDRVPGRAAPEAGASDHLIRRPEAGWLARSCVFPVGGKPTGCYEGPDLRQQGSALWQSHFR